MTSTILLATDSTNNHHSLGQNLSQSGYQVLDAANGHEVLSKLQNNQQVDLLLTDTRFPDMDSFQLARQIRKISGFRFLPVVVMTSEKNKQLEEEGLAAGITGWLCQPINFEQVLSVIKRLLD